MSPAWSPPGLAIVALGAAALVTWLVLSPPRRADRLSAGFQIAAAILLALTLVNAGWRGTGSVERPLLAVLVDRSASMSVADEAGSTRRDAARDWLEGESFSRLASGWRVEVDSFGGATTDPAAAIEAASAALPEAILIVSDGRATGGRAASPPPVPLYAFSPGPATLPDLAVLELSIEEDDGGSARAVVGVGAVGGTPAGPRTLTVLVDGREVARARVPAVLAGERRELSLALPAVGGGERVVEARLTEPTDAVAGNDARARAWRPSASERTLLVGLAPGWEIGFLRREVESAAGGPVDAVWGSTAGSIRYVDGGAASWDALEPARYGSLWLVGDPALLGMAGRRWVERFGAAGGRGVFWAPGRAGGELSGLRAPPAGARAPAPPALTDAGRRWLEAVVGELGTAPDGSDAYPPLEGLPATRPELPAGATVLLQADGVPVAWTVERDGNRHVVALGAGWYRLALEGGERDGAGRRFWRAWTEGATRWLAAASAAERPLVALPADGRAPAGVPFEIPIAEDAAPLEWRIVPAIGGGPAASGAVAAGDRAIAVGPLAAGAWRLELSAPGRRESRALAIEAWTPDLARTEADSGSLAAAARASGGGLLGAAPAPLPIPEVSGAPRGGRAVGLGLAPWAFLAATLLLLAHWAVAARSR